MLEPLERGAHEGVRVRLRRGLVLVRECLRPGDWRGMSLDRYRHCRKDTAGWGRGAPREAIGLPAGQPDCTPLPGRGHNLPRGTNRSAMGVAPKNIRGFNQPWV